MKVHIRLECRPQWYVQIIEVCQKKKSEWRSKSLMVLIYKLINPLGKLHISFQLKPWIRKKWICLLLYRNLKIKRNNGLFINKWTVAWCHSICEKIQMPFLCDKGKTCREVQKIRSSAKTISNAVNWQSKPEKRDRKWKKKNSKGWEMLLSKRMAD